MEYFQISMLTNIVEMDISKFRCWQISLTCHLWGNWLVSGDFLIRVLRYVRLSVRLSHLTRPSFGCVLLTLPRAVEILCGPPFLFTSTSHLAVVYLRIGTRFCSLYLHLQRRTGCAFGDVKRCSPAILVYALCDAYCFAGVLNVRFEYHFKYSYLVYLEPIGTKYDQGSDLFRGRALLRRGLKCFLFSCYRRYQTNYMFLYHVVFYTRFLTL